MDSTQPPPHTITHPPSTETASWVGRLKDAITYQFCFNLMGYRTNYALCLFAANRGTTAGSSGDEIGKALASVSSSLFFLLLNVRRKENLMHAVTNSDCVIIGGLAFFVV